MERSLPRAGGGRRTRQRRARHDTLPKPQGLFSRLHGHSPNSPRRVPAATARWVGGAVDRCHKRFGRFPALRTPQAVVANSSPDSVLEAFRRKSDGRSPAPLASPPGAAPLARSCGSSRTKQDCLNRSPDSVLKAFRRKSDGHSSAPLAYKVQHHSPGLAVPLVLNKTASCNNKLPSDHQAYVNVTKVFWTAPPRRWAQHRLKTTNPQSDRFIHLISGTEK